MPGPSNALVPSMFKMPLISLNPLFFCAPSAEAPADLDFLNRVLIILGKILGVALVIVLILQIDGPAVVKGLGTRAGSTIGGATTKMF